MKLAGILLLTIILSSTCLLFGEYSMEKIDGMLPSYGAETGGNIPNSPPPIDSICIVWTGVDYGGDFSSPSNYVNAKHIVNVKVGTYYFPVVLWETGASWKNACPFSFWDDVFKFWSYPDSITSAGGSTDTGRPALCSDSKGNIYCAWHQAGNPDGYETWFSKATLDTSTGVIAYNVQRPAVMISATNGDEETFPGMAMVGDTLIMVVWMKGGLQAEHSLGYNYSTDAGATWAGAAILYAHGSPLYGSWQLPCVAPDKNTGDMWATIGFDLTGNATMDISAWKWTAATNTWTVPDTVAVAPQTGKFPYALPAVAVDRDGAPHIIFQQNLSDAGGGDGLTGWAACGPAGSLFYTNKVGGSWSAPKKLTYPGLYEFRSYQQGHPSVGISGDNVIHYSTTFPDSSSPDTNSAFLPFNAHYAAVNVDTAMYGGKVSDIPWQSTINAIYPHMTYDIYDSTLVDSANQGPGIMWCQMNSAVPPADIYYCHKYIVFEDSVPGVEESKPVFSPSSARLYQNHPNPVNGNTMIRFTIPNNTRISLNVYDISGRLVKTLAAGMPGGGSYFVVWNGKDLNNKVVPAGIYLYTLTAGSYKETRKAIIIH